MVSPRLAGLRPSGRSFLPAVLVLIVIVAASCVIPHEMGQVTPTPTCASSSNSSSQGLTWYSPTEVRDAKLNRAWCETVAPPVVKTSPDGPFRSWQAGDALVVVAWNVYVGGGDLLDFLREELGLDCTGSRPRMRPSSMPFVLLLQETYRRASFLLPVDEGPLIPWRIEPNPRPGAELDIEDAAHRCGLALVYVPSARNGHDLEGIPPEDKGNAILSTVPLSDLVAIELPFEAGRKVAVGATVRAPNGADLRVVSVHLDVSSTLYRTLITGNGTRLRQVSGLTDVLTDLPEEGSFAATVVGGDFNTWSVRESALVHMQQHFPESPRDALGTRGEFPTDHIFLVRDETRGLEMVPGSYRLVEDSHLSDHKAREIRIRTIAAATPPRDSVSSRR
jgi:endonuclease/exonuclease/phosphatase family metal-dependent hydrolase